MSEKLYYLQLKNIKKEFSGVQVLFDVNLNIIQGEVHCICGENGAGKSTLMKILSGNYSYGQYEGKITLDGKELCFTDIKHAENAGIEIINQELEVALNMTVSENIFLGHEMLKGLMVDTGKMNYEAEKVLNKFNIDISADCLVGDLGVGKRQLIAIAKALTKNAKIIIFDEPTAALSESEADKLFEIIDGLKKQGVTCIYISHKLSEILKIADTITVIRDGRTIISSPKNELNENLIIKHMVGRDITEMYPYEKRKPGNVLFSVKNLTVKDKDKGKKILNDISFEVRKGEILGVAGLMGAGRTELAMALFGSLDGDISGEIYINNERVVIKHPLDAIKNGLGLIVEDRKYGGLVLCMDIKKNSTLASLNKILKKGFLSSFKEIKLTREYAEIMSLKAPSLETEVRRLSGGNQQKVVIAKTLMTSPKVLIMDEPTRGIDVGTKHDIYMIMNEIVKQGNSIIMISSELPEVLGMSDRVIVMKDGKISGELTRFEADQEAIMHLATTKGA